MKDIRPFDDRVIAIIQAHGIPDATNLSDYVGNETVTDICEVWSKVALYPETIFAAYSRIEQILDEWKASQDSSEPDTFSVAVEAEQAKPTATKTKQVRFITPESDKITFTMEEVGRVVRDAISEHCDITGEPAAMLWPTA